jgi:hypothetical protein
MSKQGTTIDPFESHPHSPKPENLEAKDIDSFTREEVTRALAKLVKQVHDNPAPIWGFKKCDLINHINAILPKLDKIKNERENTKDQSHCFNGTEVIITQSC